MIRQSTIDRHVGKRYGMLTVTGFSHKVGRTRYYVRVRCDCGTEKNALLGGMQQGSTKSCGCNALVRNRERHAGNTYRRLPSGEASANAVYRRYRADAERRSIPFDLSREEWSQMVVSPCFYCEAPPSNQYGSATCNGRFVYSGIDRVDNATGYRQDNCVPCCTACNSSKNSATKAIILKAAEFLRRADERKLFEATA